MERRARRPVRRRELELREPREQLVEQQLAEPRDRRIARLVEILRDPGADRGEATARTGLFAAHLQALFVRDVGVAMRSYRLWRRLLHAIARVGSLDLTAAAYAGGFADLPAHARLRAKRAAREPLRGVTAVYLGM